MHVTVYLICALVTALMAAYGIWRTIRIAHLGTTSKLAVTAFFALAGALHFAFLDMTDLFERAFIVDTLPVTGLFVSFAYWFFLLALARDVIGGVRGLVRRKMEMCIRDRSWTQHTAWRIDSKSDKNVIYLSVFDNGDGRGMEQPALPTMKYSRAVVYKIDQKKMTVEQIWEVGKDLGYPFFCPCLLYTSRCV